jgi:carbon storage regulator
MLVLTRKLREQICIGGDIKITVLKIQGQTVRIGIEAPEDVRIRRGELLSFDEKANMMAASTRPRKSPAKESLASDAEVATAASPGHEPQSIEERPLDEASGLMDQIDPPLRSKLEGRRDRCILYSGRVRASSLAALATRRLRRRRDQLFQR